jgi:diketogulonate reductase-like aldo/keto reductase
MFICSSARVRFLIEVFDSGSFNIRRLTNLTSFDIKYRPAVNQVELSWFNPQPKLIAWARENGVLLEAYSPLGSNTQVKRGLAVKEVKEVAEELGITPAQVILSWLHQQNAVILPKSVHESRIRENFEGVSSSHPVGSWNIR